jgi:mechanosensitive ion channel-like protein
MWDQAKQALDQSMAQILTKLASLLPGTVALLVAVGISVVVAWILGNIVRRVLVGMQFDERIVRWGFPSAAEGSPVKSPTLLVSWTIAFLVIVAGLLIGIAAFDAEWTSRFVDSIAAYVPKVLGAALVLLVGTVIARFLGRSVLISAVNMNFEYGRLLSVGVKWLVIVLAVAMALEHLRIGSGIVELAFGILFGGIVLALALAVGLGSKELVTKSLERETKKAPSETVEDPLLHV